MMGKIGGALLGAALVALSASDAYGSIAVLDQRPTFEPAAGPAELGPHADDAEVVLAGGPPPWAPAHGYRKKQKSKGVEVHHHHHHYPNHDDRHVAEREVGIERGFCNRDVIGAVIGGVAGGVIGAHVGEGRHETAATIGGTLAGVLIGGTIGRRMDQADHACVTHAVAYGRTSQPVVWSGARGERYRVVPLAAAFSDADGRACRRFSSTVTIDGVRRSGRGTACQDTDGSWWRAG